MFLAIEEYHLRTGLIHGDIKLENFLYDGVTVRLIDYEQSGYTPKYASIVHHQGKALSHKCDFESLGYAVLYSIVGDDLWFGPKPCNILKCKQFFIEQ